MANEPQPIDEKLLARLIPISGLSPQGIAELAKHVRVEEYKRGAVLFRKGESDGLTTYLIDGELELASSERHAERLKGGSDTARHPFAHLQPRQYTARAVTTCRVLQVKRQMLDNMLALEESGGYEVAELQEDEDEGADWMTRLLQSELFQKIPTANIQKIFLLVEKVEVSAGDVIVRQGDVGDFYYFIASGRCKVTRASDQDGREIMLAELREGDSFGEEALITESKRNATITMLTDGVLMRLTKDDFAALIKKPVLRGVTYAQGCGMVKLGAAWLDVRLAEEHARGAIPESINLPLNKVRKEASRLEKNHTYIAYDDSGNRGSVAAFLLGQEGFDVCYLAQGLDSCPHAIPKPKTEKEAAPAAAAAPAKEAAAAPTSIVIEGGQIQGKRNYQEDEFAVVPLSADGAAQLAVVADGMGGHAAGDVASKTAVEVFCREVRTHYPGKVPRILQQALTEANKALQNKVAADPKLQGMGCTLVAALVEPGKVWWVSVGDSHLYLLRERQLRKCNVDHSYGGYIDRMAEAGQPITPDPRYARNMLMSALTGEPIPETDLPEQPLALQPGDRLLLASDGVNTIGEGALIQHSAWSATAKEYSASLLQAVEKANKPRQDNTTVVTIEAVDASAPLPTAEVKQKKREADEKVSKLGEDLSEASKKLALALRQKAEAEAARQSAEKKIAVRMKQLEAQDEETRRAYQKQLEEERQRREEEIATANRAFEEAQQLRLAAEEARRAAEAQAERIRAEEEEMRRRLQAEAEEKLQAERRKMEAEFARFSQEIEQAQRAREQAEDKLKSEQARIQQESQQAAARLAEAERLRQEAEGARQQAEEQARQRMEEAREAEARQREELEAKLKADQEALERRIAEAEQIRQEAEQARQAAEEEARRRLDEVSAADSRQREELERKLREEREALEHRLAEAEQVRQAAEASRADAESAAQRQLEALAAAEAEQRRKLEEELRQQQAALEQRLASSSSEIEEARRLREEAEAARRRSEEEARQQREQAQAEQERMQREAEEKLRAEKARMQAQFADTVDQLEAAKRMHEEAESARAAMEEEVRKMRSSQHEIEERARAEAEEKLRVERARLEAEFGEAQRALDAARRQQEEAEASRAAALEEAACIRAEHEAAGESLRKELSEKLEADRARYEAQLAVANEALASAEQHASEAASAQQQAATDSARIREAEERARMELQAQVETQLRAEREKHKRELEEAAGLLAELERAKQEAEARRQAAEEQAAKLKSAEEDTRTQISAEQRAELEAERQRILAEAEQANAQLREARTAMEQAAMNRQLAERRSSQLAEAEQEAARLKEQARKSMEQASGEVGRLEQELAEARQLAEEQLQKSREAEEARVAAERLASDAQTQLETARQVAETYREREKLDREIRVDQKRKSSLPLVLGVIAVALIGGGAFLLKDKFLKPSSAPEAPATATTAPEAERPVTIDQLPSARPEPTPGAPAVIAPPAFEPLSLLRDKLANGTSAPRLIVIPAGSFEMGSADGATDEQPVHEVTLQAFAIGQYEVSFAEFDAFVRDTGRTRPDDNWGRGSNPVINVSWNDAVAYTEWLSKQTKQVYRLPTEAEWEYAARGGTTGAIWWNLYDEKVYARCSDCDFRTPNPDRPLAVESLLPNPYKLHHVSGNVMEWVADCYQSGYSGAPSDGSARGGRSCAKRVLRGGSFLNRMSEVRPAARSSLAPDAASFEIGFRVVRELER